MKILLLLLALLAPVLAAPPELLPMPVEITERDGTTRRVELYGQDPFMSKKVKTEMTFATDTGLVEFPIDQLKTIGDIQAADERHKASGLFTFADGNQRRLDFGFAQESVVVRNEQHKFEQVDLRKIRALQVLGRPDR